jgi:hypothetical protein
MKDKFSNWKRKQFNEYKPIDLCIMFFSYFDINFSYEIKQILSELKTRLLG